MASQYLKEAAALGETLMSALSDMLKDASQHSVSVRGNAAAVIAQSLFDSDYSTLESIISGKQSSDENKEPESLFSDYESLLITAQAARRKLLEVLRSSGDEDLIIDVIRYTRKYIARLEKSKRPCHEWQGLPKLTAS